jgi:hypothetical protein
MKQVEFSYYPLQEKTSCGLPIPHDRWFRAQFRYFAENCKLGREKNIEDFILNNATRVHFFKDNPVFDDFLNKHPEIQVVPVDRAELLIITHQGFSRLDTKAIIDNLHNLLTQVPKIYLCLNKHYINYNDSGTFDDTLPDDYNRAITMWLQKNLPRAIVNNISINFNETGSDFTWVIPPCEFLICRK